MKVVIDMIKKIVSATVHKSSSLIHLKLNSKRFDGI